MENENKKIAKVDELIALCHILDNYDEFSKNLNSFLSSKDNRNDIDDLYKKSYGKNINSKKVEMFYQSNKKVVDTINKYYSIYDFMWYNYDTAGNLYESSNLKFFYQYILDNKKDLAKILGVLNKIKKLNIQKLQLYENLDFTTDEYEVNTFFWENCDIAYLDNMEAIPNYQSDIVKYKSTGSNYKIIGQPLLTTLNNIKIIVNSLVFDANRLPNSMSKESIFDKIIDLKNKKLEECEAIKKHIDLSLNIETIISRFRSIDDLVNRIDDIENKDKLIELMVEILVKIGQLDNISSNYDSSISEHYPSVTPKILEKEKKIIFRKKNV